MAEPFKNMFREETVREIAQRLCEVGPFDVEAFVADAMDGLEDLELKDRVRRLSRVIRKNLAPDYREALAHGLKALPEPLASAEGVTGSFIVWPLCQFVEDFGLDDPVASIPALYELTRRFSTEFAIRPFLLKYPYRMLAVLSEWASDPDLHVRRLVSEGTRPRLPWGKRLQPFVEDPSPILPLLKMLRDDPEEYVRRSVANNLNDIAKDNPDIVVDLCRRWMDGANKERQALIQRALRSLIKEGHPGALDVLGFGPPEVEILRFGGPEKVSIGESALLEIELRSTSDAEQNLVIDYAMNFPGARDRTNRKVFKWSTRVLAAGGNLHLRHKHSFRPVSTRRTRPGEHRFELLVNGQIAGEISLELVE